MPDILRNVLAAIAVLAVLTSCASREIGSHQEPIDPPVVEEIIQEPMTPEEQLEKLAQLERDLAPAPTLGRGDILSISVYDEPDLFVSGIPVRPDGQISFPLVGDIQAEGRTVSELNDAITEKLKGFILAPKVSVIVQEFRSQQYTIFGEVVRPGVYPLTTEVTLTEALADAGGLNKGQFRATSVELADLTHSFIARRGEVLPVDFVRLIRQGDMRFDVKLQAGDYIYIPSGLSREVYILGEVNKPMLFAFREDMPMSRTLAQAEGFTPDADLSRIHILRGSLYSPTVLLVNFREVLAGNAREVALEPGDVVYVPPTGLTSFARIIDKIMPSVQALQVGILLNDTISNPD